ESKTGLEVLIPTLPLLRKLATVVPPFVPPAICTPAVVPVPVPEVDWRMRVEPAAEPPRAFGVVSCVVKTGESARATAFDPVVPFERSEAAGCTTSIAPPRLFWRRKKCAPPVAERSAPVPPRALEVCASELSVPSPAEVKTGPFVVRLPSFLLVSESVVAAPTTVSAPPLLLFIFRRCAVESPQMRSLPAEPEGAADSAKVTAPVKVLPDR